MKTLRFIIFIWVSFIFSISFYIGGWVYLKIQLENSFDSLIEKAVLNNIYFVGPAPDIYGFPALHKLSYSGSIFYKQYEILIPKLKAKGYLLNRPISANLPHGIVINGTQIPALYSLDRLFFKAVLPEQIPEQINTQTLSAWQKNGNKILFDELLIIKNDLNITGHGFVSLDSNLQPAVSFTLTVSGADIFADWLEELGIINTSHAKIFQTLYASMKKHNPKTNKDEVTIEVNIKNQSLYLGPLLVASLPEIEWDTHSLLVLHQ